MPTIIAKWNDEERKGLDKRETDLSWENIALTSRFGRSEEKKKVR